LGIDMPIATQVQYGAMLDRAKRGAFAYPAINVTSLETLNAVLQGFAEARSDGIVQMSTGGAAHATGPAVADMALGAEVLAEAAWRLAERHDVLIALHTDHCHPKYTAQYLEPLIAVSERRVQAGRPPLFNGHMFDGSTLPMAENLAVSRRYLERLSPLGVVLEIETGIVGGEEDGHDTSRVGKEKLYTTPEDMVAAYETLHPIGRFLLAATFGNVHGVYAPGNVVLRPDILRRGQEAVQARHGTAPKPLDLVFHGGSGSRLEDIHETLDYGVVKMNVDTDMQYAFTRAIADHLFSNYAGVLKVDGGVGEKKVYDPRSYMTKAILGMKERVKLACQELRSAGTSAGAGA
jgi:fructose-bisphosphate aldolase class II